MTLFVVGLFLGGLIGSVVMAVLASGRAEDEATAYQRGWDAANAVTRAAHSARGIKAGRTRRAKRAPLTDAQQEAA